MMRMGGRERERGEGKKEMQEADRYSSWAGRGMQAGVQREDHLALWGMGFVFARNLFICYTTSYKILHI